ncbi:O-methyltransferase [Actinomyces slackii]|uniref:O-methyltransferase MSMEG_5073 n=1 Tax=Actinomyces slackii TaxID=52774 RepID=A0A3S4SK61_9ACTO|nr:Putative O-methyltransferase MSMEG_5073 [Actinomyces slackii]
MVSADKTLSWSYTQDFLAEDEATAQARMRGLELGIIPVSTGTGAALRMLAGSVGAKSVAEVGTGTGVSGLWLLAGMGPDGVLTTIDVEPEVQREARHAFDAAGYPTSRIRIIQGRASDVMPRMAARSYDMVVLDVDPQESAYLAGDALRMLRIGGVLAVTRALWNDHVADPARRDAATVAARELGKAMRDSDALLTTLLPVGDGLLVAVRQA